MALILNIIVLLMENDVFDSKEEFNEMIWNKNLKNMQNSKEIPA
jgi:hypothetical protein